MNAFLQPFEELPQIAEIEDDLFARHVAEVSGISDAEKAHIIYGISAGVRERQDSAEQSPAVNLIVESDELRAKAIYESFLFFEPDTVYFPGKDLLFFESDLAGNAVTMERVRALAALFRTQTNQIQATNNSGEDQTTLKTLTIVTTIGALLNKIAPKAQFETGIITIDETTELNLTDFAETLTRLGYERVESVESAGEFAIRGGILDIFSLTEDMPVRIELWGDEIDSIRYFDLQTQRSVEKTDHIEIFPAAELLLDDRARKNGIRQIEDDAKMLYETYRGEMKTEEAYRIKSHTDHLLDELKDGFYPANAESYIPYFCDETASLLDYLPENTTVFLDQLNHITGQADATFTEFSDSMERRLSQGYILPRQADIIFSPDEIKSHLQKFPLLLLSTLETKDKEISVKHRYHIRVQQGMSYNNSFSLLVKELQKQKKKHGRVILVSVSRTRAKRLADDLLNEDLNAFFAEDANRELLPGQVMVLTGNLSRGFSYPELNFTVIAEGDIFGNRFAKKKKRAKKKYEGEAISGFRDLHVGDYVVHENHGLGIYRGMEKITVDKIEKDFIKIEYANSSNLYILATQLDLIQKYSGSESGHKPKLNSLSGKEWEKTKASVQSAVGVIAKELVDLYAHRQNQKGYAYGKDTVWQQEFEETFPYEETESQLIAVADVKRDMQSGKIMDRLICGDVGYGKTEIAIRAAFKAVQENKQVVFLAPTTILAEQHYNTFVQRMQAYPVNIGLLCRFRTEKEQKETIQGLKDGTVDIVIGTHRVLSKDVTFHDLGLLVIDEEQRFGVKHKEAIKQMKESVDVLSLSATPIPRTLHMSLIGIRDMTVLEEAPTDRLPIQTFVFEYNEEMVREAVTREMARGGQVYYVVNRIRNIADIAAKLESLLPEANIAYIHGRMNETELENVMYAFLNREIDVLIATTIIEIGLDISNVNTIIIHDADQFGLSQLYQLRGRVGRSGRTAYAFLLYKKDKMLKEVAEKRLSAIREYTELGSGFQIAMRDLEIRGAGNLLGKEQHGHMAAVGYDLYCKMLNTAVLQEKGETPKADFETTIELKIDAYIPKTYIKNEEQKLDIYKRIAGIETEEERDEMLDELIDRFGEPPKSVLNLLLIALIKLEARRCYITEITQKNDAIKFSIKPDAPLEPAGIPVVLEENSPYVTFSAGGAENAAPYFMFHYKKNNRLNERDLPEHIRGFIGTLYEQTVTKRG